MQKAQVGVSGGSRNGDSSSVGRERGIENPGSCIEGEEPAHRVHGERCKVSEKLMEQLLIVMAESVMIYKMAARKIRKS